MYKKWVYFLILCTSFLIVISISFHNTSSVIAGSPNTELTNNGIKVFVGQSVSSDFEQQREYIESRSDLLKQIAMDRPLDKSIATIVFNKFYNISDLQKWLYNNQKIDVNQIWFSIPGETGRGMSIITDNNIQQAINRFIAKNESLLENNKELISEHNKIKSGKIGVFAITADVSNKLLADLLDDTTIKLIDLHFDPIAESLSTELKLPITYLVLADKPDGTR